MTNKQLRSQIRIILLANGLWVTDGQGEKAINEIVRVLPKKKD